MLSDRLKACSTVLFVAAGLFFLAGLFLPALMGMLPAAMDSVFILTQRFFFFVVAFLFVVLGVVLRVINRQINQMMEVFIQKIARLEEMLRK